MQTVKQTVAAVMATLMVTTMSAVQFMDIMSASADNTQPDAAVVTAELPFESVEAPVENVFEEKTGYIIYADGKVNVRAEANTDAQIWDMIECGTQLIVTETVGDWYMVRYDDDTKSGYVLSSLVSFSYDEVYSVMLDKILYETAVVSLEGDALNVRDGAGTEGTSVICRLSDGAELVVVEKLENSWLKVRFGDTYDVGYLLADYVKFTGTVRRDEVEATRKSAVNAVAVGGKVLVDGTYLNVRSAPSENASIVGTIDNDADCVILQKGQKWSRIVYGGETAYAASSCVMTESEYANAKANSAAELQKAQASSNGMALVNEAAKYIGTRYVYGGSSPSGFDCSGLVQYSCKKLGITVGRSSRDQYKDGVAVSRENLQPGDLVFFSKGGSISHVGIYAGDGKVLHSPSAGKTVCYTELSTMCSYSTYVGARRVF